MTKWFLVVHSSLTAQQRSMRAAASVSFDTAVVTLGNLRTSAALSTGFEIDLNF